MDINPVCACIVIACIVICIALICWSARMYINYMVAQKRLEELRIKYREMELQNQEIEKIQKDQSIEYSRNLMKYLREFIGQITVIKFKTFIDSHNMDKITEINIKKLIDDIATTTNNSINRSNILFDNTIITKEFYESYIVETAIMLVKEMLEKLENEE